MPAFRSDACAVRHYVAGVDELGDVDWPPTLRTERLSFREPEPHDRSGIVELLTSSEVRAYLGGPRPRDEVERSLPDVPSGRPGLFIVDLKGSMIGIVTIDRRGADRPGHVRPEGNEAELSYAFLPYAWGYGYAREACAAVIEWFASALPNEPLVLCTQVANERSMRLAARLGFTEMERFEAHGAEQWFGVWSPASPA